MLNRRNFLSAGIALGVSALLSPVTHAQTKAPYVTLEPAYASSVTGKVEVLEFFAYTCPHCSNMEPMTATWARTLPENVVFNRVPVAFNAGAADLQKLYFSLEAMGRLDLHAKVFHALHKERKRIYDFKSIAKWMEEQGVDRKAFESVFQSFGVSHKAAQANTLTENYHIKGTPSLAVGGRYVTSPGMAGSYASALGQAHNLLEKVLADSKR